MSAHRRTLPLAAALAGALALAACGGSEPPTPDPAAPASQSVDPAVSDSLTAAAYADPLDFALPLVGGDTLRLASLRGRVVLVNVWATWCVPCREETPDLIALRGDLAPRGLEIVGLAMDLEGAEKVAPFVQQFGIPYPVVLGNAGVPDSFAGMLVLPTTFVLGRDGRLVRRLPGRFQTAQVRPLLESLLEDVPGV